MSATAALEREVFLAAFGPQGPETHSGDTVARPEPFAGHASLRRFLPTEPSPRAGEGLFATLTISGRTVVVDEADLGLLSRYSWWISDHGYVVGQLRGRGQRRSRTRMHRLLLDPGPDREVDHIDRDKLNNTRRNLRPATRCENAANKDVRSPPGLLGISRDRKRWRVRFSRDGRNCNVGSFGTLAAAQAAYAEAVRLYSVEEGAQMLASASTLVRDVAPVFPDRLRRMSRAARQSGEVGRGFLPPRVQIGSPARPAVGGDRPRVS